MIKKALNIVGIVIIIFIISIILFQKYVVPPLGAYQTKKFWKEYENKQNLDKKSTLKMKKILSDLFKKSLQMKDNNYFTSEQIENNWIGNQPATQKDIEEAELRLGIKLPIDYKEFVQIANGYPTYNDSVEPSFEKISQIQYLKDFDSETIRIWKETGNEKISNNLNKSIIIAGKTEEQWFLLIPPTDNHKKWKYWKFANWIPGEIEYKNLSEYFFNTENSIE